MKRSDSYWMDRCLELASRGAGKVSPNPLVGAVIVKNGKKIGEGFHARFGGPHAEINAIQNAKQRNHDLTGATLYVNLEPCSHHGKTPPCVDAILKHGFHRVVIAMEDPNPFVAGTGIKKLLKNGIRCTVGIRSRPAHELNEQFTKFITTKTPFVAIKAAQTRDGFIAREDGSSQWITNARSRAYGHYLRSQYDAVVVGATTVRKDDPELTVRMVKGRNPVRIVVDGKLSTPITSKIFNSIAPTIVYAEKAYGKKESTKIQHLQKQGVTVVCMNGTNGRINIRHILNDLGQRNIASLLVEGGQHLYSVFFNARSVDKLWLFTAPKIFQSGIKTFAGISVSLKRIRRHTKHFSADILNEYDISY